MIYIDVRTQENSFVVYDLRFDCRYLVRVQSVTNQGVLGATTHLTIATPSCHDVAVVGAVMPDCPRNGQFRPRRWCDVMLTSFDLCVVTLY